MLLTQSQLINNLIMGVISHYIHRFHPHSSEGDYTGNVHPRVHCPPNGAREVTGEKFNVFRAGSPSDWGNQGRLPGGGGDIDLDFERWVGS